MWRSSGGRDLPWPQLAAAVVIYLLTTAIVPGDSGWGSITSILVLASFVGLASAGQTFAALLGGLDEPPFSLPEVLAEAYRMSDDPAEEKGKAAHAARIDHGA